MNAEIRYMIARDVKWIRLFESDPKMGGSNIVKNVVLTGNDSPGKEGIWLFDIMAVGTGNPYDRSLRIRLFTPEKVKLVYGGPDYVEGWIIGWSTGDIDIYHDESFFDGRFNSPATPKPAEGS